MKDTGESTTKAFDDNEIDKSVIAATEFWNWFKMFKTFEHCSSWTHNLPSNMSNIEWALIRSKLPPTIISPSRAWELARMVIEADFKAVLLSPESESVFASTTALLTGLDGSDEAIVTEEAGTEEIVEDGMIRLIISIALLHAFVQANWTGPDLPFSPVGLLPSSVHTTIEELDTSAISHLTLHGEPAYHLSTHPSLLLFALRLLDTVPSCASLCWWKLRARLVHLSLLDEPVDLSPEFHTQFGALEAKLPKDDADLVARYHLELGLLQHALAHDKPANQDFLAAAKASGLEFELTGALGKKTKYQIEAHSQLVLLAESRQRSDDEATVPNGVHVPETLALNDDTLLEETEFTKLTTPNPTSTSPLAHLDPSDQPPLHPLDQSLLLSLCLSQHNQSPSSGLTASQMMPFVTRVVSHPRNWSVHTTALLLRSRLESRRSRTVERSALQLAALIEQMPTSDSAPAERLRWFHQIPLPSRWEMEKELAKRYLSLGVVRSALDIFTRLELWEDAVSCLQRMERDEEAETIVKDLLAGKKIESDLVTVMARSDISEKRRKTMSAAREAKLWCLLGDIALTSPIASRDPHTARQTAMRHYNKAWEVSNHTLARSRWSIGSLHFNAKEYDQAAECLRAAVAINPLNGRAWFTLGVCLVRLERWSEAKDAFRRQVGVDEDDGEGWNNLAAVYLRLDEEGLEKGQVGYCSVQADFRPSHPCHLKTSCWLSEPFVKVFATLIQTGACGPIT